MDEGKGTAYVILGIVAIIAIVGLVLLLTSDKGSTGKLVSMAGCDAPDTPVLGLPGENADFLKQYVAAGYTCERAPGHDAYGKESWCCKPPRNVPVNERFPNVPIDASAS